MLLTLPHPTPIKPNLVSHVLPYRIHKSGYVTTVASKPQHSHKRRRFTPSFELPNPVLAQSAVAVFALGFIDAGYSGDWSRIGVISKEKEDLLKLAAFLVVPLCIFAIFSISKKDGD